MECALIHTWCCRLQQRQKLRERREQRAKAAEDDRRNGLTEAERVVREAKAARNMEALLQELDEDAARAAAKQDTRRARRKGVSSPMLLQSTPKPLSSSTSASYAALNATACRLGCFKAAALAVYGRSQIEAQLPAQDTLARSPKQCALNMRS